MTPLISPFILKDKGQWLYAGIDSRSH